MAVNIFCDEKGLGILKMWSRKNAANHFLEKNFLGSPEKELCSGLAVKVADFAQYWSGVRILF